MEDLESEQWRAVEGYPGYEVSIARAELIPLSFFASFYGQLPFSWVIRLHSWVKG